MARVKITRIMGCPGLKSSYRKKGLLTEALLRKILLPRKINLVWIIMVFLKFLKVISDIFLLS